MATCIRCGSFTDHASGTCSICEASSGHGTGTPADVPCQRCGMYLPSHELQMWNARLYCAYCIMDMRDEEEMLRRHARTPPRTPEGGAAPGSEKTRAPESSGIFGTCEKCGAQENQLYSLNGRLLCQRCCSESGGAAGPGSMFGMIVQQVRKLIRKKEEPKILVAQPPDAQELFDPQRRRMVQSHDGLDAALPLSEDKSEAKKPSAKAKKSFFSLHSEKKK